MRTYKLFGSLLSRPLGEISIFWLSKMDHKDLHHSATSLFSNFPISASLPLIFGCSIFENAAAWLNGGVRDNRTLRT